VISIARPFAPSRPLRTDAEDGDQQQVEQPVEHGLLARVVLDDLLGEVSCER
jgi:hypothetical protein